MALIGNILSFYLTFILLSVAHAAVDVQATVDTNQLGINETFTYTISVSSDESMTIGDHRLPSIVGLDLVGQFPTRESRSAYTNGKFQYQQTQRYAYTFQTTQVGQIHIPAIEIFVNGQSYQTKAINVTVSKTPSGRQQQPQRRNAPPSDEDDEADPFYNEAEELFNQLLQRRGLPGGGRAGRAQQPQRKINPDEAFFLQLEVDKNEVYVGEQVTATWYIYTRNQIQNIDTLKYPNLKAFLKEDIEVATRLDFQNEVINGLSYRKALLVSYALFPLKPGVALVDSYKARSTVLAGGSLFGMGNSYTFTKASPELKVRVKELPKEGQPRDFTGGVGQFKVRASVDQGTLKTNQPFTLKIRLEGRGNAKSIDLPSLSLPQGLEVYSQRDESKFNTDGTSYKEFEVLLIPRSKGEFTIPAINFSFFNPNTGKYYAQSTNGLKVQVDEGGGVPGALSSTEPSAKTSETTYDLITVWQSSQPLKSWAQVGVWCFIFLSIFAFLYWRARKVLGLGVAQRTLVMLIDQRSKKALQLAKQENYRAVGTEMTNLIYDVLGEVTGESGTSSRTLEKVFEQMPPGMRQQYEGALRASLKVFETLSFAPETMIGELKNSQKMVESIQSTVRLLKQL